MFEPFVVPLFFLVQLGIVAWTWWMVRRRNVATSLSPEHIIPNPTRQEPARHVQRQQAHEQKMEAIARFAGCVAHDLNNVLTIIIGYSDILLSDLPNGHPAHEMAQTIKEAGARASALTQQLTLVGCKQPGQPERLDVRAVIADCEPSLRAVAGPNVQLRVQCQPSIGPVHADAEQLERVLSQLTQNAFDALPAGGTVTLAARDIEITGDASAAELEVPAGRYVMLSVTDNGHGMDDSVKNRMFEPFFTTKQPAKGRGLGLATVYGIVKQCAGYITVDSRPSQGTTVRLYLSLAEEPQRASPATPREATSGDSLVIPACDAMPLAVGAAEQSVS